MQRVIAFSDGYGFTIAEDSGAIRDIIVTKLDGWFDGAEVETERVRRLGDGVFSAPTWRGGRKLTLGMKVWFDSEQATVEMARAISGIFPSGEAGPGELVVADEWDSLAAMDLSLDGQPKVALDRTNWMLECEIPLMSIHPYLYGPLQSITTHSPGAGEGMVYPAYADGYADFGTPLVATGYDLKNFGNQVAWPTATVRGSFPSGFRLEFSGQMSKPASVIFAGDVNEGFPCEVDLYAGRVINGGADQSYLLTKRQWGGVNPGGQCTAHLTGLGQGSGSVDITLRSTYA